MCGLQRLVPASQFRSDVMGVILLEVVDPRSDISCCEVLEVLLTPLHQWRSNNGTWRGIQQELGQFRPLKPLVIGFDYLDHISWLTGNWNLIRPAPDGFAACRILEWLSVAVHFRLGQLANNAVGNDLLNKHILIDNQIPTNLGSSESLEQLATLFRQSLPARYRHENS